MKIGIITSYPPSKTTLNEYGYHLVKNFVNLDVISEIKVYCDDTVKEKFVDFDTQQKVKFINSWKFNSYFSLFRILHHVLEDVPDVVLINGQFMKFGDKKIPAAMGLSLGFVLKILKIKNVFLIHNILEKVDLEKAGFTENKILQMLYQFIGKLLTMLVLQSNKVAVTIEEYAEILQKKYHADNIVVIPHGSFEVNPLKEFRTFDEKVIMTFGKFGTYKKVEKMLDAVELLYKKHKNAKLKVVIAGTDNPNVKGYLKGVQEKYSHLNYVEYTGYVPENQVEKLFDDSTVVIFPYSSTTGSSGVLHQAGSYGKSAVLPNIGDLRYLIEKEGFRGEYFSPESTEELATAIEKIIFNDEYRRELEIANYKASTSIPMSAVCHKYFSHFNKLLIPKFKQNYSRKLTKEQV